MKIRYLALISIVLMLASAVQPIFAFVPGMQKTSIVDGDLNPFTDIITYGTEPIHIKAVLLNSDSIPLGCRYISFYVFRSNPDGSNGDLVFKDRKLSKLISATATSDGFVLSKGVYNLDIVYYGNRKDNLRPYSKTVKINVPF